VVPAGQEVRVVLVDREDQVDPAGQEVLAVVEYHM
jgi:hypothetical protein